jgi:HIRAN domain
MNLRDTRQTVALEAMDRRGHVEYADRQHYDPLPVLTLARWDYGNGLDETAAGYGFRTPDGRTWAAPSCRWSTWHELGVLVISVVGSRYYLENLSDSSFEPGQPVRLFAEPSNPHDPKAIAIRNWTADKTAGYVKKGSTSRLRNLLHGHDIRVMVLSCRYGEMLSHTRESVKVAIFRPDRLVGADIIPPHPVLR